MGPASRLWWLQPGRGRMFCHLLLSFPGSDDKTAQICYSEGILLFGFPFLLSFCLWSHESQSPLSLHPSMPVRRVRTSTSMRLKISIPYIIWECSTLPCHNDANHVYKWANMVIKIDGLLVLCSFWPLGLSSWDPGNIFST